MFRAAVWPCRCASTQCSTRMRSPVCGSGQRAMSPAAKIPGTLVSRNSFHGHAAIHGEASAFGKREARTNSHTHHHEIGLQARAIVERDRIVVDSRRLSAQVEHDTLRLV